MASNVRSLDAKRTGVAIRSARELAGMRRASDLAERIGEVAERAYSANRVTKLEKGYRMPHAWELDAISQVTGWSVEHLMHPPFPIVVFDDEPTDPGGTTEPYPYPFSDLRAQAPAA